MSRVLLDFNICSLEEENSELLTQLDKELSYFVQGSQYLPIFKGFYNKAGEFIRWNGYHHLLTSDLTFPRGLLDRVVEFYQSHNLSLEIFDQRQVESAPSIDISGALKKINKEPFYYQNNAVEAAKKSDCGILRLPTGSGKTLITALLTSQFGKKTNIYVIGKDLLYQFHNLFTTLFDKVGIIGDGKFDIQDINIVSVWTVGQALNLKKSKILIEGGDDEKKLEPEHYQKIRDLLKETKIHIFDECHIATCDTIQEIAKNINPERIYGMSASPMRDEGSDLAVEAVLGRKIIDISASELIAGGYLVKPTIKFLDVPPLSYNIEKQYKTIYKHYITDNPIRNAMAAKATVKLAEQGFKVLTLFNNLAHGQTLYELISKDLPCLLLSGKDDQETRDATKQLIEDGKIGCILASRIFDLGIDLPCLSGLVIASSGKSSVRATQRIGRVVRNYKTPTFVKKNAAVVDFKDNAPYLEDHSKARYKTYSSEAGFDVFYPPKKKG